MLFSTSNAATDLIGNVSGVRSINLVPNDNGILVWAARLKETQQSACVYGMFLN